MPGDGDGDGSCVHMASPSLMYTPVAPGGVTAGALQGMTGAVECTAGPMMMAGISMCIDSV